MEFIHYFITRTNAPEIVDNGLESYLSPSLPSAWGLGRRITTRRRYTEEDKRTVIDRILSIISTIFGIITISLLPSAFEIQAYFRLFQEYGYQNLALWFSAAITALLLGSGVISYVNQSFLAQ